MNQSVQDTLEPKKFINYELPVFEVAFYSQDIDSKKAFNKKYGRENVVADFKSEFQPLWHHVVLDNHGQYVDADYDGDDQVEVGTAYDVVDLELQR